MSYSQAINNCRNLLHLITHLAYLIFLCPAQNHSTLTAPAPLFFHYLIFCSLRLSFVRVHYRLPLATMNLFLSILAYELHALIALKVSNTTNRNCLLLIRSYAFILILSILYLYRTRTAIDRLLMAISYDLRCFNVAVNLPGIILHNTREVLSIIITSQTGYLCLFNITDRLKLGPVRITMFFLITFHIFCLRQVAIKSFLYSSAYSSVKPSNLND